MIDNNRVLALIPARGGSKGLPGKNTRLLENRPLLAWSIDAARSSNYIDEIIVSTDNPEIGNIASACGARVEPRPERLATDSALVADAIRHLLVNLERRGELFDLVVLLQPTTPIRPDRLVDDCLEELTSAGADSIATFSSIDVSPEKLWLIEDSRPRPLVPSEQAWLPRQAMSTAYQLNGLLYVFRVPVFIAAETASVLVGRSLAKITREYVDIDTIEDFHAAEKLIRASKTDDKLNDP